jgi:hypothetical protein
MRYDIIGRSAWFGDRPDRSRSKYDARRAASDEPECLERKRPDLGRLFGRRFHGCLGLENFLAFDGKAFDIHFFLSRKASAR